MSNSMRPNVLLIMADQLPWSMLGAYGHPTIQTPNIDRLAAEGVAFENCYCNVPICAPSRASFITGRLPSAIGAYDNGTELPASVPTFLHHLRRSGYRTVLSGKMHFIGPDQLHGFETRLTPEIYPSWYTWTPDWRNGVYPNPGTSVSQLEKSGKCTWSLQLDHDEEVLFRTLEELREIARHRDEESVFLCASFTHPHDPFIITPEYWDLYEKGQVPPPAAPAVPIEEMHPFNQWLQIHHEVDRHPPSEDGVQRSRHAYFGMVSYFDRLVGRILDELRRLELVGETIVVLTSDHGEMLGEHGMWFKRTFFDPSTRVPLIVTGPGVSRGRRVDEVVSLVDLFPTFVDLCAPNGQTSATLNVDGDSLLPLLFGNDLTWKDEAVCEYYGEGVVQPMRMLRKGRHKYVFVPGESPLLFDLDKDPHELVNVSGVEGYEEIELSMRQRLLEDWDADEMVKKVLQSQQDRLMLKEVYGINGPGWDHVPQFDQAQRYVRRVNAQEASEARRIPPV